MQLWLIMRQHSILQQLLQTLLVLPSSLCRQLVFAKVNANAERKLALCISNRLIFMSEICFDHWLICVFAEGFHRTTL